MICPAYLLLLIYHCAFQADLQGLIRVEFLPIEQTGSIFFPCYQLMWNSSLDHARYDSENVQFYYCIAKDRVVFICEEVKLVFMNHL